MTKVCKICGIEKDIDDFPKRKSRNGKAYPLNICKKCLYTSQRKRPENKINELFKRMERSSKVRNHDFSIKYEDFKKWIIDNGFNELFNKWVESGFKKELAPSVDRIDTTKPYAFDNMRLVTWKENHDAFARDLLNGIGVAKNQCKPVMVTFKDGTTKIYHSISALKRDLKVSGKTLHRCMKENRPSRRGMFFKFI
jgi:hypothetical protein